jgi:hypothetical protein
MASFKLPTWCYWVLNWEQVSAVISPEMVQAYSCILLKPADFQILSSEVWVRMMFSILILLLPFLSLLGLPAILLFQVYNSCDDSMKVKDALSQYVPCSFRLSNAIYFVYGIQQCLVACADMWQWFEEQRRTGPRPSVLCSGDTAFFFFMTPFWYKDVILRFVF